MDFWEKFTIVAIIAWTLWFNRVVHSLYAPSIPIEKKTLPIHPTKGAYGGQKLKNYRIYLIAGGTGFVGSWIARYLLARGETNVYILDREKPSQDLIKHGINYFQVELTHSLALERELLKLHESARVNTSVIVYNCCLVKLISLPNFQRDLGINAIEMLYVSLRVFEKRDVFLIHVGHTLAHRGSIRNWDRIWPTKKVWFQETTSDLSSGSGPADESEENKKDRTFSSYAWHQLQVEQMTLKLGGRASKFTETAILRIEGFASGHLGDGFLSPVLQRNNAFVHSPHTPITITNIEDVARGCLSLEHLLLDPETRDKVGGKRFTVASSEVTTLHDVFDYCRKRRPKLKVWSVPPALVFLATCLMQLVFTGKPVTRRSQWESILDLNFSSLTFARFYSLQTGQVPNPENAKRQYDVLSLENNFTLSQTLDSLLDEIDQIEKQA